MGKKHKKHHKKTSDIGKASSKSDEPPIKLVLKVGAPEKTPSESKLSKEKNFQRVDVLKGKDHSTKKKKKKRSSSKERKKRKHAESIDEQGFDSSSTVESNLDKPKKKAKLDGQRLDENKPTIPKIHIKPIEPPKFKEIKSQDRKVNKCAELENEETETHGVCSAYFYDVEPTSVLLCLGNLHQSLQRKDVNGFFAYPVNDVMAPGYSSIISRPMDFSMMKYKIDTHAYTSLEEFRDDFNLMCNNAMIYNTAETVYYKAAKKLLQIGAKMMSRRSFVEFRLDMYFVYRQQEKFRETSHVLCLSTTNLDFTCTLFIDNRRSFVEFRLHMYFVYRQQEKFRSLYRAIGLDPPAESISFKRIEEDAVIDVDTVDGIGTPLLTASKRKDHIKSKKRATAGQRIQAKAEEAARKAAEKLAKKYSNSNIGFLRTDSEGNTSLAILNPCADLETGSYSIPVNLASLTGKLTTGTFSTNVFKEDKKNKMSPVTYLKYGPFSSFSPTFDSSMATITKEDSDLLFSVYGDSTGVYYAQSLQAFVKDNVFAKNYVDCVLDGLTDGAHSKLMEKLKKQLEDEEEKEKERINEAKTKEEKEKNERNAKENELKELSTVDVEALLSLEKEGIDVSFLKQKHKTSANHSLQDNLDRAADLIAKLDAVQSERLSQVSKDGVTPKSALKPSENEQKIAEEVTQELTDLTSKVYPKDVVNAECLRKATGIGDISEIVRKGKEQSEMEVQLAAEAIETVFNDATMEDLDKVICEAAREVEGSMGLDVLDELTASLDDVKQMEGI
ncbi:bromodomain-containing protein 9-like [Xenia sp. Carnegie-2017]|uniref:bromodomain-containing protein 9-like n=1 Tax=Xenia sp. Carnegie-2017 TaxID=2897299 RepID=UPI001F03FC8D|nr:bromodomain-containing protein 9-like [Xenia sp. Carnegie-2017]